MTSTSAVRSPGAPTRSSSPSTRATARAPASIDAVVAASSRPVNDTRRTMHSPSNASSVSLTSTALRGSAWGLESPRPWGSGWMVSRRGANARRTAYHAGFGLPA